MSARDTVASIYALDELPSGSPEDYAHVAIARYKRALSGDSFIGGVWTSRFEGPHYNVVAGSDDLSEVLLERHGLAVVPGSAFDYDGGIRLSFTLPLEALEQGLGLLLEALRQRA